MAKENNIKMKREPTIWENIFANDTLENIYIYTYIYICIYIYIISPHPINTSTKQKQECTGKEVMNGNIDIPITLYFSSLVIL